MLRADRGPQSERRSGAPRPSRRLDGSNAGPQPVRTRGNSLPKRPCALLGYWGFHASGVRSHASLRLQHRALSASATRLSWREGPAQGLVGPSWFGLERPGRAAVASPRSPPGQHPPRADTPGAGCWQAHEESSELPSIRIEGGRTDSSIQGACSYLAATRVVLPQLGPSGWRWPQLAMVIEVPGQFQ